MIPKEYLRFYQPAHGRCTWALEVIMFAVKLNTQLDIEIVKKNPEQELLQFCYENIGCQYVETVRPRYLQEPYILMIDEEGRLKDRPAVNFIASYLYGAHEHHEPIVGNVLAKKYP